MGLSKPGCQERRYEGGCSKVSLHAGATLRVDAALGMVETGCFRPISRRMLARPPGYSPNMNHDDIDPADDPRESTLNAGGVNRAKGWMGVSSERIGPAGPGQVATDGVRPTAPQEPSDIDTPPEQHPGNPEANPKGLKPKAGYPEADPRHE